MNRPNLTIKIDAIKHKKGFEMTNRLSICFILALFIVSGCVMDFPLNTTDDEPQTSSAEELDRDEQDSNPEQPLTELDECPNDPQKTLPGECGCGIDDSDSDGDGTPDCLDKCSSDKNKNAPGLCGCGTADTDGDGDGTPDCLDKCPHDSVKVIPGVCGCGTADADRDGDTVLDCLDVCPDDPAISDPSTCACGSGVSDSDGDGSSDCKDLCRNDPHKTSPGQCGCGTPDMDSDGDGALDCHEQCPANPGKYTPGTCGCGTSDTDLDKDGTPDCIDSCRIDPNKIAPGQCGCGTPDTDADGDTVADCYDECPSDPNKSVPLKCGCGHAETDSDNDGTPDCLEPLTLVDGLERTHRLDVNRDGIFETEVCEELAHVWTQDDNLKIASRSFGFAYAHGDTPCKEIDVYDRWSSSFEGFLTLVTADGTPSSHTVEFAADVNDGVRMVLKDAENQAEICKMALWFDVPKYDNYHSTDGYAIDYGCKTTLTAGVYYPVKIEVYHESDPNSMNSIFNRAYLDMFYWGVPTGGSIKFYRADK